jgi:hypothetical protein
MKKITRAQAASIQKHGGRVRVRKQDRPTLEMPATAAAKKAEPSPDYPAMAEGLAAVYNSLTEAQKMNAEVLNSLAESLKKGERIKGMRVVRKKYQGADIPLIERVEFVY